MTRARDLSKGLQKTVFKFSGDTGQTTFTTADDSTALSYTVGLIDVYYNGVKLAESEYTATNGTSIVLDSGVEDDDIIEVVAVGSHSFTGGGDMNGSKLILDTDGDTSIHADTDDQIDIEIAGADDFAFKANKFEVQTGSNIDMNGTELILDADGDTSITADTDDQIDIKVAGADDFRFTANNMNVLSGSTLTIDSGATITNSGTATGFGITRPNVEPLIINGDMAVAQRGTVTGITNPGTYGGPDRVRADIRGGFTVQLAQSTDVPSGYGFANSAKLDVTTADASPDANGLLLLVHSFEGQDVQLLKYGTSEAETVTIAFWIKSNKTGTFQVNLRMVEAYHIGQLVTISSANTWEKKVITFAGNTSNAIADDNSNELRIQFFFDAGSDSEGGGVPSSWAAVNEAKSYNGSIDLGDNTANEVLITGLQFEVGSYTSSTLPAFQHESFGNNLARCQRYYFNLVEGNTKNFGSGAYYNANLFAVHIPFPVTMRAAPSVDKDVGTSFFNILANNTADACDDLAITRATTTGCALDFTGNVSGTQGHGGVIATGNAGAKIAFQSEL